MTICQPEDVKGEYGILTAPMTVADFEEKKVQLDGFISRIFVNF